jgi:adenosylcobinamide amidohydrolase
MQLIKAYQGLKIDRRDKALIVHLSKPHAVLSSCPVFGGLRQDLAAIVNHQCCEPHSHFPAALEKATEDPSAYLQAFCRQYRLPANCVLLSTAVNINNAAPERMSFGGLEVISLCTAGVESNAARAGDPASVYETRGCFRPVGDIVAKKLGTINLIICINRSLTPAAMVTAAMTAVEAKAAVMAELNVNSRYSAGIATGTGTDQIALAARTDARQPLSGAGKHTKLGELIARTVAASLKKSLVLQNRLSPQGQCSVKVLLERFSPDKGFLKAEIAKHLPPPASALLVKNFDVFSHDPVTVAAVSALIHLHEQFRCKILPAPCRADVFSLGGAQLVAAVCGKPQRIANYRETLPAAELDGSNRAFLMFLCRCLAMGFREKWIP